MEDLGRMTERLEYGFHIKGRLEDHFREELTMKVGYVLQWKHEADVAENDGRNGRPLWIYLGLDVFDITSNYDLLVPSSTVRANTSRLKISPITSRMRSSKKL